MLNGTETKDMNEWRRSLRTPISSVGNPQVSTTTLRTRTPSPARSSGLKGKKALRSRSPSPKVSLDKSKKSVLGSVNGNGIRRSISGSMTADLSLNQKLTKSSTDLENIEGEYIKNLQQQIYFLELESSYLREQAKKATDMHPHMKLEAERMLNKLRAMQKDIDDMDTEIKRKESSIGVHTAEKSRLQDQLKLEKESREREKRLLMEELVTLKKDKDRLEREIARKDEQLLEAKTEVDRSAISVKNADLKISTLKAQLEQRVEQHNLTQIALEEKRTELLSTTTQLRETEERYLSSTATIQDKVSQDLRDEIRLLHQKVKDAELSAEKDRFLRDNSNKDTERLIQENAGLNQKILELAKQLDREKELRDTTDVRHTQSITELVSLRDKGGNLAKENDQLRDQLRLEQDKSRRYLEQLTNEESASKSSDLQVSTMRSRLSEMEGVLGAMDAENSQLRKDKSLLVDHVAELQRKIEDKERDVMSLRTNVNELNAQYRSLDFEKNQEIFQQSQRWEEFGRLADSMKSLSQSMMSQSAVLSPKYRDSPAPQQY